MVGRLWRVISRDCRAFAEGLRPAPPPQPGVYTYVVHCEAEDHSDPTPQTSETSRLHLRIERDGAGVLFVDVTDVIHLNVTAAELAKWALDGVSADRAAARLTFRFGRSDRRQWQADLDDVYRMIGRLRQPDRECVTCGLPAAERRELFSTPPQAPYKADLAITYDCNNDCPHCYNEIDRHTPKSLPTADWLRIVDTLCDVGVPHLILTGGEPTMHPGVLDLIEYANSRGPICGMNTNGRRLSQREFADELKAAGLNHVQITLGSHRADVHDRMMNAHSYRQTVAGIENALASGLHTITNTTLMRMNAGEMERTISFLHGVGIRTFAVNGMIHSGGGLTSGQAIDVDELAPILIRIRDHAHNLGMKFLWYTPTEYCRLSPTELEIGAKRCNAGEYSVCIEPNGDVLPCQSFYVAAGNLLRDPWDRIWNGDLFRSFRDRVADPELCGLPEKCSQCPDLLLCGGGCRLEREAENSACCGCGSRATNDTAPDGMMQPAGTRRATGYSLDEETWSKPVDWNKRLKRWLVPDLPSAAQTPVVEAGIYHFQRERDGAYVRFHLRVDRDGCAILIAAASEAVRLSPLGAAAALALLEGETAEVAAGRLGTPHARSAVDTVGDAIDQLGRPDIRFPIINLTDAGPKGRSARLIAPFQADVVPGVVADVREMLSRLWNAGVFHARLLPQDDSDWEALSEIVEYAEDPGMITGIRAFASRLVDEAFVRRLAAAGLDYVIMPWAILSEVHAAIYGDGDFDRLDDAVRIVRAGEMTCVLETPLLVETTEALDDQLQQLDAWDVSNLEFFAVASRDEDSPDSASLHALAGGELRQAAAWIEDLAEEYGLQIAWLPPVASTMDTSVAAIARRGPRAAGDLAIRVEASGDVLAARGSQRSAGNLLQVPWDTIWGAEVFDDLREGRVTAERCRRMSGDGGLRCWMPGGSRRLGRTGLGSKRRELDQSSCRFGSTGSGTLLRVPGRRTGLSFSSAGNEAGGVRPERRLGSPEIHDRICESARRAHD